jgi:superfamily II DNA/RNA helicase
VTRYPWSNPSTVDEWRKDPSRKLDVLVEVLQWHLKEDARAPLEVVDGKLVPSAHNPLPVAPLPEGTPCDKIVVYCAFPSSYIQLVKVSSSRTSDRPDRLIQGQVLDIHGIKSLQIHGRTSQSARTAIINQFKTSGIDGPRVLVMSSVGQTGLNLPFASILTVVVRFLFASQSLLCMLDSCFSLTLRIRSGRLPLLTNCMAVYSAIPS